MTEFKITWQEERSAVIEATDIKAAERRMFDTVRQCGNPDAVKVLSIYRVDAPAPPNKAPLVSAA